MTKTLIDKYYQKNLKYVEMNSFYNDFEWDKCNYWCYFRRVKKQWLSFDKAISPEKLKKWPQSKTKVDDNGRECTKCLEYKEWDFFNKNNAWPNRKQNICKECQKKAKKEYRERTGGLKDKEYRKKKRILEIWSDIAFTKAVYIDWMPREDVYTIIKYVFHKWYLLQSKRTKEYRRLDTNDNRTHERSRNCTEFYRL